MRMKKKGMVIMLISQSCLGFVFFLNYKLPAKVELVGDEVKSGAG